VLPAGRAYPTIGVAAAPSGTTFNLAMYVPTGGLAVSGGALRASTTGAAPATAARPVPGTAR
jgi:hypothetical protein